MIARKREHQGSTKDHVVDTLHKGAHKTMGKSFLGLILDFVD